MTKPEKFKSVDIEFILECEYKTAGIGPKTYWSAVMDYRGDYEVSHNIGGAWRTLEIYKNLHPEKSYRLRKRTTKTEVIMEVVEI